MRRNTETVLAALVMFAVWPALLVAGPSENWPQWRGPNHTAVVPDDPGLPEHWSNSENVGWKTAVPGIGWSSPIVWDNKVFVTSVIADEDYEDPRAGLYLPDTGDARFLDPLPGTPGG